MNTRALQSMLNGELLPRVWARHGAFSSDVWHAVWRVAPRIRRSSGAGPHTTVAVTFTFAPPPRACHSAHELA